MYETVQAVAGKRPDRALECLDLIDDLLELEDLRPETVNVADIAALVLHLAESSVDDDLQEKALNVLSSVVKANVKPAWYNKTNGLLGEFVIFFLYLQWRWWNGTVFIICKGVARHPKNSRPLHNGVKWIGCTKNNSWNKT